nr:MAG: capsid protein precursor [Astroviridae sp.]
MEKPQRTRRPRQIQKKQIKQEVKKEVKKETTKLARKTPQNRSPRTGKLTTNAGVEVGYVVAKESEDKRRLKLLEKRLNKLQQKENGPRPQSVMSTTLTLGPINGSSLNDLNRQMRYWFNPTQLKPEDSLDTVTPLSVRGSQYDLWKVLHASVTFQPLVGSSVVTGSLVYCDLDQEASSAKPETIDSIKARPHLELALGRRKTWVIPARFLQGPRMGWWYVDTNEDPSQSLGPGLNFWTYMQTQNLFQKGDEQQKPYTGPLFLAEMTIRYAFANYNPKPALSQLKMYSSEHDEQSSHYEAKFKNDDEGNLIMEVKDKQGFGLFLKTWDQHHHHYKATGKEEKSTTLWSLAGTAVSVAANALGPWGWLLKGGWWVIRKIFNAPGNGQGVSTYMVYASVEDASKDNSIKQTVQSANGELTVPFSTIKVKQINNPNLNNPGGALPVAASAIITPPVTPTPTPPPTPEEKYFMPLVRTGWLPSVVPMFYTYQRSGQDEGQYKDETDSSWAFKFYITGIPALRRVVLKYDRGYYFERMKVKMTSQGTGKWFKTFQMPNLITPTTTTGRPRYHDSPVWFWADLRETGVLMSNAPNTQVGNWYSSQGTMHTFRTWRQSVLKKMEEAEPNQSIFLEVTVEPEYQHELPDGTPRTYNKQSETIFTELGIHPDTGTLYGFPVALDGDPVKPGLFLYDMDQDLFGILFPLYAKDNQYVGRVEDNNLYQPGWKSPLTAVMMWTETHGSEWPDLTDFSDKICMQTSFTTKEIKVQLEEEDSSDIEVVSLDRYTEFRSAMNVKQNYGERSKYL